FTLNGAMVDMSRNAVMNLKTVKYMLRKMALMGLNAYMLYTEDTYEISNRPYFGYMRGRYTRDEIRELDSYALMLGIELIPCIQMLGHLATTLRWTDTAPYKDTANALLVGADETYSFIEDMIKSISGSFTSRRLHMGMDETHDLGTGKYLDRFGYRERKDLYFEHLAKVTEIAKKYGFKPMMWSDMFFRMSAKNIPNFSDYDMRTILPENIGDSVPEGVQQIFWDYYNPNEEFYAVNLDKHDILGDNTMFAGGIWCWSGHTPLFSRSIRNTIPALEACKKKGIKEVIATIWHNGSESNLIMSLAGLAMYADYDYKGGYFVDSIRKTLDISCDACYDEFIATEEVEYPHGTNLGGGTSRALLYNDPLLGMVDKHLNGIDTRKFYRNVSLKLAEIGNSDDAFKPAFDVIKALCSLLENKADFGIRLKKAYEEKNIRQLAALAKECEIIYKKTDKLRKLHRKSWMKYNKSFGWEVHDIRYGGILMRFDTVKDKLLSYVAGEIDYIEELEAKKEFFGSSAIYEKAENPFGGDFLWYQYQSYVTAGRL
ncbi:MAG: beta-N-acetylhexosaminidase, partial [Clostridiales bacterium]|nr:beta-N-acetylhexosaminidase [Clostridiales bacterium]